MILFRYRPITVPLPILAGVTYSPSSRHSHPSPFRTVPHRSLPFPTVTSRTVRDGGDGEGWECHDDGRSVTMGHDDLKIVMGQNHNFNCKQSLTLLFVKQSTF